MKKKNNYYYEVVLMNEDGSKFYSLKKYTSLQNAKRYVWKEMETVKMGVPMKNGLALRINKIDKYTDMPVIIYLN